MEISKLKKYFFLIICILSLCQSAGTQNLILNPSFEDQSDCPDDLGELFKASHWKAVGQTPDLFDTCGSDQIISPIPVYIPVPQYGDAFVSTKISFPFRLRNDTIFREYMQGTLSNTLVAASYYLTFNVLSSPINRTNHLDVYFSPNDLDSIGPYPKNISPQFRINEWIGNYSSWQKHCGCIENIEGANFFTLGNFNTPGQDSVEFPNVEFSNRIHIDNFGLYQIPEYVELDTCISIGECYDAGTAFNGIPVYHLIDGEGLRDDFCADVVGEFEISTLIKGCDKTLRKIKVEVVVEKEEPEPEPEEEPLCKIYVPNSFSPNGDGVNDFFKVFANCNLGFQIKKCSVYNRWGGLVYQGFNTNEIEWDGRSNDGLIQSGVYVWVFEYEILNKGVLERRVEMGDIAVFP